MRKISVVLFLLFVIILCPGCTVTVGQSGVTVQNNGQDIYSTNSKYKDSVPSIEETVFYDENSITVTAKNLGYDTQWDCYVINLEIQNNSESDISYNVNRIKVDGFTIDAYSSGEIYSQCKANAEIGFDRSDIQLSGITDFQEMFFNIDITNVDYDTRIATISAYLKTDNYNGVETNLVFNGDEIYNNDGIQIYAKPNSKTDIKHPLILYIVNNTNNDIILNYDDIAYNGEMIVQWCTGPYLLANSKKVLEMDLYLFDDIEITEISTLDMKFTIYPYDNDGAISSANMYETPRITINY